MSKKPAPAIKFNNMNTKQWIDTISIRPKEILSQNSKLRKDNIFNITFPAFKALISINGNVQEFKTCPQAKDCAAYCYARQSTYMFTNSRIKHARNLQFLLNDPYEFKEQLVKEISKKKKIKAVRLNDSGDIHPLLFNVMRQVMLELPHIKFYAYTKSVKLLKEYKAAGLIPSNFTYVFSYGGYEDHLIDKTVDRHAIAFPNRTMLRVNNYTEAYNTDVPASNPKTMRVGLIAHGNHLRLNKIKKMIANVMEKSL